MKKTLAVFALALLLVSCSSTNYLTIPVVNPPRVPLGPTITKVGIVDRSKSNSALNKIDQFLSMESSKLEKEGAKEILNGLESELKLVNRFDKAIQIDGLNLQSKGMGVMSQPLDWTLVDDICKANDVDILFVLEAYDTDTHVDVSKAVEVIETRRGERVRPVTTANMNVQIKGGWRIYDPFVKQIEDEYRFTKNYNDGTKRVNPLTAVSGVVNRASAIRDISFQAGQQYAYRVTPSKVRVSRRYYVKGNENFKTAKRLAQTGKWTEASLLWKTDTESSDKKIAGRAYYNMAVANEINGRLDLAIDWASQSYEKFNNKKALSYVNVLKNRKQNEALLEDLQMK